MVLPAAIPDERQENTFKFVTGDIILILIIDAWTTDLFLKIKHGMFGTVLHVCV